MPRKGSETLSAAFFHKRDTDSRRGWPLIQLRNVRCARRCKVSALLDRQPNSLFLRFQPASESGAEGAVHFVQVGVCFHITSFSYKLTLEELFCGINLEVFVAQ